MTDLIVDAIDVKLIETLQDNSRLSFAELGRVIGLSPSATRMRLQKLEDCGVVKKYKLDLDYRKLGYDVEAFVLIKVFHGKLKGFLHAIKDFPEVIAAHRITGNLNVHLRIIVKNQLELQRVIDELIFFGDTNTYLILSEVPTGRN